MRGNLRRLALLAILVIFSLLARRLLLAGRGFLVTNEDEEGEEEEDEEGAEEARSRLEASGYAEIREMASSSMTRKQRENSAPAYAPGAYMAGRIPTNRTACSWYYGLPKSLAYPSGKMGESSPEDKHDPYRILPDVVLGRTRDPRDLELPSLTLCTHATADQLYHVVELARRWEGALSLAVFAPGLDAGLAVALLERACRCEPEMSKVSVHLVFPGSRPPALSPMMSKPSLGDCAASDLQVLRQSETERKQRGMTYPINVARNVARDLSRTRRVLVTDIELLPSEKLASGFLEMTRGRVARTNIAFVLPIFEIESREKPPRNKRELLDAVSNGRAVYFHRFVCTHCQRFPGITRWLLRPDPDRVRSLIVTKREHPYQRWEPVFIGTKDDPAYDEEMSWEGRQDKMGQMLEMCLKNYRLIVLDGAFLVHTPGIKYKAPRADRRKESSGPVSVEEERNARIYLNLTRRLLKKYPTNRRCGQ